MSNIRKTEYAAGDVVLADISKRVEYALGSYSWNEVLDPQEAITLLSGLGVEPVSRDPVSLLWSVVVGAEISAALTALVGSTLHFQNDVASVTIRFSGN